MIPTGWRKNERNIARIVSSNIKGSTPKDCFNDYLESIAEDNEELLDLTEEFIKDFDAQQIKEKVKKNV